MEKKYPDETAEREAAILKDMLASRLEGEEARPSVEALLHSMVQGKFVVHTHPALINGMTLRTEGRKNLPGALRLSCHLDPFG